MGLMEVTQLLQEKLDLELPPVGMALLDEPPEGVLVMGKEPPSFCTLWRWGETSLFYAPAELHLGCLVGAMVSGVPLDETQMGEVKQLMEEMCPADPSTELRERPSTTSGDELLNEPNQVPKIERTWHGILYGPLWRFPVEPDLALMWVTIVQAGVLQDVAGKVLWRGNPEGAVFPRPACSVLATALERDKPALSLGCVGMREYTKMPEQFCLLAVPGSALPRFEEALAGLTDAEDRMEAYVAKLRAAGMT